MNEADRRHAEKLLRDASLHRDLLGVHLSLDDAELFARKAGGGSRIIATARKMRKAIPGPPTTIGLPVPPAARKQMREIFQGYREHERELAIRRSRPGLRGRSAARQERKRLRAKLRRDV